MRKLKGFEGFETLRVLSLSVWPGWRQRGPPSYAAPGGFDQWPREVVVGGGGVRGRRSPVGKTGEPNPEHRLGNEEKRCLYVNHAYASQPDQTDLSKFFHCGCRLKLQTKTLHKRVYKQIFLINSRKTALLTPLSKHPRVMKHHLFLIIVIYILI